MSDHQFIAHQDIGDIFSGIYYVSSCDIRKTVRGDSYMDLTLRDSSGSRDVKYWSVNTEMSQGDFVKIEAKVEQYNSSPSFVATNVTLSGVPESMDNYISKYEDLDGLKVKFEEMVNRLEGYCKSSGDSTAINLVSEVFKSDKMLKAFTFAPGSDRVHYGKVGGLLAATIRVASLAESLAIQNGLSEKEKALTLSAGLIHRVGALDAFNFEDLVPTASLRGTLLGISNLTMARIQCIEKS